MAYQQKDGQGSLFKNDRKEKDSHPDYKGSITINGEEFWLSAWIKKGEKTFMSLAAQPKEQRQERQAPPARKAPASRQDDMDDDIPF